MMMSKPILYSFRRCPYAMRARLALVLSQQHVMLREVVLKDKPQALLDISPKATVPVMVLGEGHDTQVIDESLDIVKWCIDQIKRNNTNSSLNIEIDDELIAYNDGEFKTQLDQYKYFERYPEKTQLEYRDDAKAYLSHLDQILQKQAFLSGNKLGLLDICILPFIRQFAFVDKHWFDQDAPQALRKWLNDFIASDLFKAIMLKYPKWEEGNDVVFPEIE